MAPIIPLPAAAGFVAGPVLGYTLGTLFVALPADAGPAADARRQAIIARQGAIALGVTAVAALFVARSADPSTRSVATGAAVGSAIGSAALYLRAQQAQARRAGLLGTVGFPYMPVPSNTTTPPGVTPPTPPIMSTPPAAPPPATGPFVARIGDAARVSEDGIFGFERPDVQSAQLPIGGPFGLVITGIEGPWARVQLTTTHPNPPPWREFWVRADQLQPLSGGPVPPRASPNPILCTPLSAVLPQSALSQAEALLGLDLADPRAERRPSAASVSEMRNLAVNLRYCGAELGAQEARDRVVTNLERRALDVEAALRAR